MGEKVRLGKTEITVEKTGFGALPIQRISDEEAVKLLRKAYDAGVDFFDTARAYSDSEHKISLAFEGIRDQVKIATKSMAKNGDDFKKDLETSLRELKTDHVDIIQFHNPEFCPKEGGEDGLYDAALEAKKQGKVLHIGITNHRLAVAKEAIESGLYETMQFPFSYLSDSKDEEIITMSKAHDMGCIGMKSLAGGLITNARAAYAFASQYDNLVPIWGVQREWELDQFLEFVEKPAHMDDEIKAFIEKERKELSGDFCRSCGYCMPCPEEIEIFNCARMIQLIRRMPSGNWLSPEYQEKMMKIKNCRECGSCSSKCPYGLDTPSLLKRNLEDYENILAGKVQV